MRNQFLKLAAAATAMTMAGFAMPAYAQDEEAESSGPFTLSGGVAVLSDYRFRGVSLNDKDFAVQPTLTLEHESGLYLGVWGSNVADNGGDDVEVDVFAGFGGGDLVTYDLGVTYYLYPGASDLNYVEFIGKLGTTVGPASIGATLGYVPSQDNVGNEDNVYVAADFGLGIPNTPLSLAATIGYEDGAFGDDKVDWSLGLSAEVQGFTIGASYVDTNRRSTYVPGDSKATVVFSIAYNF